MTSTPNPASHDEPVTFTATVSSDYAVPVGSVEFKNGSTSLGTWPLDGSGKVSLTLPPASGTHEVTASYAGNSNFNPSASAALDQVVKYATTTALSSQPKTSSYLGQVVTYTAEVSPTDATGTVTFTEGSNELGTRRRCRPARPRST
ncbi:MAG: Ig-like domain-containing protein [Dehalococcoidia bacterium]|nr:Ig-like domain-containing protein [Dehalococcoidia bacterium]